MVFYFSTKAHKEGEDAWLIYMGKDKHENEDLIKHGWPVDVWCVGTLNLKPMAWCAMLVAMIDCSTLGSK